MVKLGREVPVASMDNSGKIIWAKHNEIQTVNIKSVGADYEVCLNCVLIFSDCHETKMVSAEGDIFKFIVPFSSQVTDGERLPLGVKELGTCDLYPQVSWPSLDL